MYRKCLMRVMLAASPYSSVLFPPPTLPRPPPLVAYWLREHGMKVMLAACDTFRAGAVEQLRTHARRLDVSAKKGREAFPHGPTVGWLAG